MCHNVHRSHRTVTGTETPCERLSRTLTLVRLLLEAGANINRLDHKRYTALHWAVTCICPTFETGIGLARVLLDYGADINSIGRNGSTPLHFAATWNIRPAVSLLVEAGANVHRSDIYGLTSIHLAAMNSLARGCVRILEGAGGDIHPIDCEGAGAAIYPINIDTGSNGSRLSNKCSNDCYYHYHDESCPVSFYERHRLHPKRTQFLHNYT
ncbi:ankyrin repeat-containing domain protein [Morchella snyderi]|nr:ankyrin repeat-containing domain protein [Morchella snyderi]